MAAKKKKAKKAKAKAKRAPARKAKTAGKAKKASKRPAKKPTKKAAKRPAKKTKAAASKSPAKKARRAPKKKQTVGEGDYAASRAFLKDQSNFVEKNKANIPGMGRAAEEALDGPQGDDLRNAEAIAAARSRDTF